MLFVFLPVAVLLLALPSLIAEANLPMRTATQLYGHDSENVIDVMVVGSGLCGSTAAFYLKKNGSNVFLADSRDVVGGNVITNRGNLCVHCVTVITTYVHFKTGYTFTVFS